MSARRISSARTAGAWLAAALAAAGLRGGAIGAPTDVPIPWDRVVDDLAAADTAFVYAAFGTMPTLDVGGLHGGLFYTGSMYIRWDEAGRLVADIEDRGRLSFDGGQLWLDRPDPAPPVRLADYEPIATQVIPYIRAGMPGATWRVVTAPEPGIPSVHDENWAEVRFPFAWADLVRIYVLVNTDGLLTGVRVVDAATGEMVDDGDLRSEIWFRSRYWNIPLEPDMTVKTERTLRSHGYPSIYRKQFRSQDDFLFLYHERIQRLPLTFDVGLSEGGAYPGPGEGPGWPLGPLLCTGTLPWHDEAYRLVWTADPQDPRLQLAQAASDDGCAVRLEMEPQAELYIAGGVRGRVLGTTSVLDANTMVILDSTPLELLEEGPINRQAWTERVKVELPPGTDISALIVELQGTVGMRCVGTTTPQGQHSFARVKVMTGHEPRLTWDHCGWP